MRAETAHPPYDDELGRELAAVRHLRAATITPEMVPGARQAIADAADTVESLRERYPVEADWITIDAGDDRPRLRLLEVRPSEARAAETLLWVHGGGGLVGDPTFGIDLVLPWVVRWGVSIIGVDYRLAPDHPDPAAVDDCVLALQWLTEGAGRPASSSAATIVVGHSAGAGIAAGAVLAARDAGIALPAAQMLMCPMLDDREATRSSRELDGDGIWDRTSNRTAWSARLGAERGGPDVSVYSAPARALNLSGLPPTYLDVGSVDTFRDETVEYASGIWRDGGIAELHVWPGAYHSFESVAPDAAVTRDATTARTAWLGRILTTMRRHEA